MNKKPGRPPDPDRNKKKPTWAMLTDKQRRALREIGGYQAGIGFLVDRLIKDKARDTNENR